MFGVEEVNAAGVQPQALTSGLVPASVPAKSKFKEHPASTYLLAEGKCSRGLQLWTGTKVGWRSPCSAMPGGPCWLPARAVLPELNVGLLRLFMSCQLAARSNLILAKRCCRGAARPQCFFRDDKELIEKQITMMAAQAPLIKLPATLQCE